MLPVTRLGDAETSPFAADIRDITKAALDAPELMSLTAKFA
jgi:hypothetical protein